MTISTDPSQSRPNHPTNIPLPLHHAPSLQLTWRCNAACRFCAIQCSPHRTETMPIALFEKILGECLEHRDRIQHFEVTGGEVFMELELLEAVAHRLHEARFPYAPISNAFWATSVKRAREVLARIPGIWQIIFSVDRHHREFVPEQNVINAVRACQQLGIHSYVTLGYFAGETGDLRLASPELRELLEAGDNVEHNFFPAIALGRARDVCMDEIPDSCAEGPCLMMARLEISPEGDYDGCCVASTAIPGGLKPFRLGNAWHRTEAEMSREFLSRPLLLALATIGPAALWRLLNEKDGLPEPHFTGLCDPCVAVCQMPNVEERAAEILETRGLWKTVSRVMWELYRIPESELPLPGQEVGR